MTSLAWLLPAALTLGLMGLAGFLWALRNGQFEDLDGAGWRALEDAEPSTDSRAQDGIANHDD
jgi:cbb3-type cytochrome oxidase maturation protein